MIGGVSALDYNGCTNSPTTSCQGLIQDETNPRGLVEVEEGEMVGHLSIGFGMREK